MFWEALTLYQKKKINKEKKKKLFVSWHNELFKVQKDKTSY